MSRKIGNAQSRTTFFRHSAVVSLPAVLLCKLPIIKELKHARFWDADGKRKWAVFPYNSSSHITFRMLSTFSRLWMISVKMWETPLSWHTECSLPVAVRVSKTRVPELPITQQDGWKTRDGRMTKKSGARLCIPNLTRHLFVILPSWVFQPSCCISSVLSSSDELPKNPQTSCSEEKFVFEKMIRFYYYYYHFIVFLFLPKLARPRQRKRLTTIV